MLSVKVIFRNLILIVGGLLLLAAFSGCSDSTPSGPTATPVIIYVVITPTQAPATNVPAPATALPTSTQLPSTKYNNPQFGVSAVLPGLNWKTITTSSAAQGGTDSEFLMSRDHTLQFGFIHFPGAHSTTDLRAIPVNLEKNTSVYLPPTTITETTFHGQPAIRWEAVMRLGAEGDFRTVFYFFSVPNASYEVHAGKLTTEWEAGGAEEVEAILDSISVTGLGSQSTPSNKITKTPEIVVSEPTTANLSTITPNVPLFSGGLGLTEGEWRRSGLLNVPNAPFSSTTFIEGRVSDIYVAYAGEGVGGDVVPLEQVRAASKRLLPNDALVVTEFTVYKSAYYSIAFEVYTSASLATQFKATPDAWKGGKPGTISVYFSLYGEKDANNFSISIGQGEVPKVEPIAIVNDNDVNFRTGPGYNYESMAKFHKGTKLFVRGRDSSNKWLAVITEDTRDGWIMTQYTDLSVNVATLPAVEPPPSPVPPEQPITFRGSSTTNTKPFTLSGGAYTIAWSATASHSFGCVHGGYLEAVDPSVRIFESFGSGPDYAGTENGTTEVYNLSAGRYYFNIISGCDWSVSISPQR